MPKPFPPFEIGKPGKAVATSGVAMDFTPEILAELAETYDSAVHDAPLVVGHPKLNSPAYGWTQGLQWNSVTQRLIATPRDVNPEFAEAVAAKAFPKRSMSIYLPGSPSNPKPGKHCLRHIGFLGGLPPAIRGLSEIQFGEAEEGVLEFGESEYDDTLVAQTFQALREWLLTSQGQDVADKVIPADTVAYLLQSAAREAMDEAQAPVQFSETPTKTPHMSIKPEELAARETALKAKEAALDSRMKELERQDAQSFAEGLETQGKLLPRQKPGLVEFLSGLTDDVTLEFGEGDDKQTQPRKAWLKQFLAELPAQVDFGEVDTGEITAAQAESRQAKSKNPLLADAESRATKK